MAINPNGYNLLISCQKDAWNVARESTTMDLFDNVLQYRPRDEVAAEPACAVICGWRDAH